METAKINTRLKIDTILKILRALNKPLTPSLADLLTETGLSKSYLHEKLVAMEKGNWVKRIRDKEGKKKWKLTPTGHDALEKLEQLQSASVGGVSIRVPFASDDANLQVEYKTIFTEQPTIISGSLKINGPHKARINSALNRLKNETNAYKPLADFFRNLGLMMSYQEKYGNCSVKDMIRKEICQDTHGQRSTTRDFIDRERASIDFDANLLISFKGRELASKINWDDVTRRIENLRFMDPLLVAEFGKNKDYRQAWIEESLATYRVPPDYADSKEELEAKLVKHVLDNREEYPRCPTEEEILEALRDAEKEGVLTIVPKYVPVIDQEKASKRRKLNGQRKEKVRKQALKTL